MKIVSTPITEKTSPNFRMTKEQKAKLKEMARSRGDYIQDYMDLLFEKLDEIDKLIYEGYTTSKSYKSGDIIIVDGVKNVIK